MNTTTRILVPLIFSTVAAAPAAGLELRVPRQPLDSALNEVSKQTGLRNAFLPPREMPLSSAVDGPFDSAEAAYEAVLACTGYRYLRVKPDLVRIVKLDGNPAGTDCIPVIADRDREQAIAAARLRGVPYIELGGPQLRRNAGATSSDAPGLQGLPASGSPGLLPGSTSLNVGGIGNGRILVDGKAELGVNLYGNQSPPDIQGIPLAALYRIEVIPPTASAMYRGSNPGGYTLNYALDRTCSGRLSFEQGDSFHSGSQMQTAYGQYCMHFGTTDLRFSGSFSHREVTRIGDRDFTLRSRYRALANNPGAIVVNGAPLLGAQPNLLFVADDGSPIPGVPDVTTLTWEQFAGGDAAAALANRGTLNTQLADSAQLGGARSALLVGQSTRYGDVMWRHHFGQDLTVTLDFVERQNNSHSPASGADSVDLHSVFVPKGAPGNFLGRAFIVALPVNSLDADFETKLMVRRFSANVTYNFSKQWQATFDLISSESIFHWSQPLATDLSDALAMGRISVFGLVQGDLSPWLQQNFSTPLRSRQLSASVEVNGGLEISSRSSLTIGAGFENAQDFFDGGADLVSTPGGAEPETLALISRQYQSANSAAVMLSYLFSNTGWIGLRSLEFTARARWEGIFKRNALQRCTENCSDPVPSVDSHYRSVTPSLTVIYEPFAGLSARTSFGLAYRVPTAEESSASVTRVYPAGAFNGLVQPGGADTVLVTFGGNPLVQPEKLKSWSAGLAYTPAWLTRFKISGDYTVVRNHGAIVSPIETAFLDYPSFARQFAESVTYTNGTVTALNVSARNVAEAISKSWIIELQYSWTAMGALQIKLLTRVSRLDSLKRRGAPTLDWEDLTALTSAFPSRWNGRNEFTVSYEGFEVGVTSRYAGGFRISLDESIRSQGSDHVRGAYFHDAYLSYHWMAGKDQSLDTTVRLSITNILNTPARADVSQPVGLINLQDDVRMRGYFLGLTMGF